MSTTKDSEDTGKLEEQASAGELTAEALVGAAAGATTGALAGPPGMVAGALIGGAIGAAAGVMLHRDRVQHEVDDEQLDRDIGVSGGNIGEAAPGAPPAVRGAFHASSLGVGGEHTQAPSEGPMQSLDED